MIYTIDGDRCNAARSLSNSHLQPLPPHFTRSG